MDGDVGCFNSFGELRTCVDREGSRSDVLWREDVSEDTRSGFGAAEEVGLVVDHLEAGEPAFVPEVLFGLPHGEEFGLGDGSVVRVRQDEVEEEPGVDVEPEEGAQRLCRVPAF